MTHLLALPKGTELVGDYRIKRVLGAGGFGITYLADEPSLARLVTIKEYFPSDFAARDKDSNGGNDASPRSQNCSEDYQWGLDRFIEEAQTLAKFDHPNIVRVYRYFRAHNTGYMVLHFEEGASFKGWLTNLRRAPRQHELDAILAPLLDALELIHSADFLHRDIAPDNIIIRKAGDPVLIDFGSARGEIAQHSKTVSALVKPGYSPYEQYAMTSRNQGPWTDIYSLAATLYMAISGRRPADSPSRVVADEFIPSRDVALSSYRPAFLEAIDKGLRLNVEARPQSIAAWRRELLAPAPAPRPAAAQPAAGPAMTPKAAAAAASGAGSLFPAASTPPQPPPAAAQKTVIVAAQQPPAAQFHPTPPPAARQAPPPAQQPPAQRKAGGGLLGMLGRIGSKSTAKAPTAPPPAAKRQPANPPAPAPRATPAPVPAPRAAVPLPVPQPKRKPPKPRRIRSGGPSRLRPLMIKLAILVALGAAALAMQGRYPNIEQRGAWLLSSFHSDLAMVNGIDTRQGDIRGLAFAGEGTQLVTSGGDGTIRIWNSSSGTLVRTIEMDNGAPNAMAVGQARAVTGHKDGNIVLWGLERGEKIASFRRNEAAIWSVAFAGDDSKVVASSHDWTVSLWNSGEPAKPAHVFEGHSNAAQAAAYSTSGEFIASGGADNTVKLWRASSRQLLRTYKNLPDFVTALAFTGDGQKLAAGCLDGNIRLYSTHSSRTQRTLEGHDKRITGLVFSPDRKYLASSSLDGVVRLWDVARRRSVKRISDHNAPVTAIAFSPDGKHLASAGKDGKLRIWKLSSLLGSKKRKLPES